MPVAKTLSEYDFCQLPELNGAQFRQLCETTDWVDAGENVLLFGACGLGKSHLAAAIVDGVVDQGYRARFYSAGELLQELRKARVQLKLNELLLKLDRYRVIVVDDLGYVKRDSAETGVLFELIAHRYERGSLVITSNHPFSMWGSIFVGLCPYYVGRIISLKMDATSPLRLSAAYPHSRQRLMHLYQLCQTVTPLQPRKTHLTSAQDALQQVNLQ